MIPEPLSWTYTHKKGRRGLPPFIYAVSNAVREIVRARNIHVAKKLGLIFNGSINE